MMEENIEELMRLVCEKSGKSEKDVQAEMDSRKEKTHGLLSDYGALYAVAKEQGIDLSDGEIKVTEISDLEVAGSVNLAGRVKVIYGSREFARKDGSKGRFASIVLVDSTGEVRVVFWDDKTEAAKNLRIGDVVLVKNGYTKEHRGRIEVHAGRLTSVSVNPDNMALELPEVKEETYKVGDLKEDLPNVNILARVSRYYPPKQFDRSDGTKGKRASFLAEDETGSIRCVLWDSAADFQAVEGDFVMIEGAYTRLGLNNELELQAGSRARLSKSDKKIDLPEMPEKPGSVKVGSLSSGMQGVTVSARVMRVYPPREYSNGMMASLVIGDETGSIRAVLWDDQSKHAKKLEEGDAIEIVNGYTKPNLDDEPEIHVGKYTELRTGKKGDVAPIEEVAGADGSGKKIIDLGAGESFVRVKGKIVEVEERPLFYYNCPECKGKVTDLGGSFMCDSCGMVEPEPRMMASVILEDDSSNIRVVSFREKAEKLLGFTSDDALALVAETGEETEPLKRAGERLVGKSFSVVGNTKYNEYSQSLEMVLEDIE